MNNVWLKICVVEPASRSVLYGLPPQPLPPTLCVSQLRSYLEQRFGPPLSEPIHGQPWMEFENPATATEALGTRLLAIPLVADPRTHELVPVFEKLAQFADIAAALGTESKLPEPGRIWVGPLFNHRYLMQQINDLAAQAMRSSLLGAGLKGEIDKVLEDNADDPVPTVALVDAMRDLDAAVLECVDVAEAAIETLSEAMKLAASLGGSRDVITIERLHVVERRFTDQCDEALAASRRTERITRDIAQIGFGISACATTPLVEILDRAGVAVLHPPRSSGIAVPLLADGLRLRATSDLELPVELAGVICRILVDRRTLVELRIRGRADEGIEMEIEADDTLLVTVRTPMKAIHKALIEAKDWRAEGPGVFTRRWPSPVTAIQPARLISKTLFGLFKLPSMGALEISIGPGRKVEVGHGGVIAPASDEVM